MARHDIIVIGASAGGIEPLETLTKDLPEDVPAAIFIVLHTSPTAPSLLAGILNREGKVPVVNACHNEKFQPGRVYVAMPDHHLLLEHDRMLLVRGPKENHHRPAIDCLFRSAALAYGSRVIGVILSGTLDDGTVGLWQIKSRGGLTVVQEPKEARFPGMPQSALDNVAVDHRVPVSEMGALLIKLAGTRALPAKKPRQIDAMKREEKILRLQDTLEDIKKLGKPSVYTCPDCSGILFELREGKLTQYRCRTGHAYGALTLLADQRTAAESALWAAARALREKADVLLQQAQSNSHPDSSRTDLEREAGEAARQAEVIRDMIGSQHPAVMTTEPESSTKKKCPPSP